MLKKYNKQFIKIIAILIAGIIVAIISFFNAIGTKHSDNHIGSATRTNFIMKYEGGIENE